MKKKKKNKSYDGFVATTSAIRQSVKMFLNTSLLCFLLALTVTCIMSYILQSEAWVEIISGLKQLRGITKLKLFWAAAELMVRKNLWIFILNLIAVSFFIMIWFRRRAQKQNEDIYLAGARLLTPDELNERIKKDGKQTYLKIAGIDIPTDHEPKHALAVGSPGAGKTTLITESIKQWRDRGDIGIVYDFKGDYFAKIYDDDTDVFFNPLDSRGVDWNLFSEIKTVMDIEAIASSLIPQGEGTDKFWHDGARDILIGIIHYLIQNNKRTNKAVWEAVTANSHDLARWLMAAGDGGKSGYVHLQDPNARHVGGMLSTLQQFTRVFQYMTTGQQANFSVNEWIASHNGWIFLSNYPDLQDTLRPILSLFVDIVSRRILSLPDDRQRRIHIVVDEFGTLHKLKSLQNLLTLGRSKGACVLLGVQDIGQVDQVYTRETRQTIVNACGSAFILNVADPDLAQFLSNKIGDTEYSYVDRTQSYGIEDAKDALSIARREKTKKLILPSDIMNLKDLELFLKLPDYFVTRTFLEKKHYIDINVPFIVREDLKTKGMPEPDTEDPLDKLFSSGGK